MIQSRPITQEDRLRIYAAVQTEFGADAEFAEIVCTHAEAVGVEKALLDLNYALATLWTTDRRRAS